MSEREPRYVFTPPQSFFVFRSDLKQLFHHYFCERSTTIYTTRETHSTELEDKTCFIVGAECVMHCGCGNGNNSDTRLIKRKIGAPFLQCNIYIYTDTTAYIYIYICVSQESNPLVSCSNKWNLLLPAKYYSTFFLIYACDYRQYTTSPSFTNSITTNYLNTRHFTLLPLAFLCHRHRSYTTRLETRWYLKVHRTRHCQPIHSTTTHGLELRVACQC